MATTQNVRFVEERIGYVFVDKDTLRRALIAAGAEEENPDGNRKLANVGTSLVEFLTIYIGFEAGTTRGRH
jgi:dsRNA-specific ribonuclease